MQPDKVQSDSLSVLKKVEALKAVDVSCAQPAEDFEKLKNVTIV